MSKGCVNEWARCTVLILGFLGALQAARAQAPDSVIAWEHYQLGADLLNRRDDPRQAEILLMQAVDCFQGDTVRAMLARLDLSIAWVRTGEITRANDSLNAWMPLVQRLHPQWPGMLGMANRRLAAALYQDAKFEPAMEALDEAEKDLTLQPDSLHIEWGWVYTIRGNIHFRQGDFAQAGPNYVAAYRHFSQTTLGKDLAGTCNNVGIFHLARNQMEEALPWFELAQQHYATAGIDSSGWANLFQNMGILFTKKNDPHQALTYFEKVARIRKAAGEPCDRRHLEALLNLAYTNSQLQRIQEASACGNQAVALLNACPTMPEYARANTWSRLADIKATSGDTALALQYYDAAIGILQHNITDQMLAAGTMIRAGNLSLALGEKGEAEALFYRSLNTLAPAARPSSPSAIEALERIAAVKRMRGEWLTALSSIQEAVALQVTLEHPEDLLWEQIPPAIPATNLMATVLAQRSLILEEGATKGNMPPDWLFAAYRNCEAEMDLLSQIQREVVQEASRIEQQQTANRVYQRAMRLAYLLWEKTGNPYWQHEAFAIAERNQAVSLLISLKADRLGQRSIKNKPFLAREDSLRRELAFYGQLLAEPGSSAANQTAWKEQQFALQRAMEAWKDSLARFFPDYYRAVYAHNQPEVAEVQAYLQQDSAALVEYFWGSDALYACWFSADTFFVQSLPLDSLEERVQSFRRGVETVGSEAGQLARDAYSLFQTLLAPGLEAFPQMPQRLLVVTDGMLAYVPFSALLTSLPAAQDEISSWPFLIRQMSVGHTHSAEWHLLVSGEPQTAATAYLGFAPSFRGEGQTRGEGESQMNWSELPGAKREMAALAGSYTGTSWQGAEVNEQLFKRQARAPGILHVTTHGVLDDAQPMSSFLVFSPSQEGSEEDGRLFAWELYDVKMKASLVVLSACNTASGAFRRGEGLMSLARAFHFAGSPSLVATLWQVQDQSTAEVMEGFYPNLAAGMTKEAALASAQQAYLAKCDPLLAHPFYWAGLVSLGDQRPLPPAAYSWPWLWLLLLGWLVFREIAHQPGRGRRLPGRQKLRNEARN